MKKRLLLSTLLVSSYSIANPCLETQPALNYVTEGERYGTLKATELSAQQHTDLLSLMKNLAGQWQGETLGYSCVGSDSSPQQNSFAYTVSLNFAQPTPMRLQAKLDAANQHQRAIRHNQLTLIAEDNVLRVDETNDAGNIQIDALSNQQLNSWSLSRSGVVSHALKRDIQLLGRQLVVTTTVYSNGRLSSYHQSKLNRR